MLDMYVKPECMIGASSADPLRINVPQPNGASGKSLVEEPIPDSHKNENSRMEPMKIKFYDARAL